MSIRIAFACTILVLSFMGTATVSAQTQDGASSASSTPDIQTTAKAQVLEVVKDAEETVPGTSLPSIDQTLKIKVLNGDEAGKELTIDNDYAKLGVGDIFYLIHTTNASDGTDYYTASDPYRLPALYVLIGLFVLCVIVFGGKQGIRGLFSLVGSLLLIFYLLLPAILHGYPPVLVSIAVASLIIIVGSYITHGFNKTTSAAVVGMIVTIVFTGLLAYGAVHYTHLTGYSNEESVYLNIDTNGTINFMGLLLGGILIGLLGVLYDISISQAVAIEELHHIAPHVSRRDIYKKAIRIGREHIGALVNTLAIAYVGASLPLLLLFYSSAGDAAMTINREIFATEIVRILIGSIGLVVAVPIVTLVSIMMLVRVRRGQEGDAGDAEIKAVEAFTHHHHTEH